ncbi:MurR/RpiR family transcriptional regulator [Enterococcus sp. RIT-PI-f]|uniref:MurR/RpiR family transcriptional regulator n=1 Tax=Enterococcus sp. RIT-PI-f TaxID=1690244 RepID=UPI000B30996D|nr:MurR/RpiR family transcriptional regulator [Enterococcus sp. RIT-PI-f]
MKWTDEMNHLYKQIQYQIPKLNRVEKNVLDYCLNASTVVSEMTATQLALQTFTSQATVSRMAKKLGFAGFQEFKFALKNQQSAAHIEGERSQPFALVQLIQQMVDDFTRSMQGIDPKNIQSAARLLEKAKRVEFFALGQSMPVALSASRKLRFLGKPVGAATDWDELFAVSNHLTSNDLAVFISLSGETIGLLDYADRLNACQVPIIAFTGVNGSSLTERATLSFTSESSSIYTHDIDLSPRVSLAGIVDVLLIQFANQSQIEKNSHSDF